MNGEPPVRLLMQQGETLMARNVGGRPSVEAGEESVRFPPFTMGQGTYDWYVRHFGELGVSLSEGMRRVTAWYRKQETRRSKSKKRGRKR